MSIKNGEELVSKSIDYVEQDIYDYFGADQNIWQADRHELLGVIGGLSGILELIWHGHVTPEIAFKDFKSWLKERDEINAIQVEITDDA